MIPDRQKVVKRTFVTLTPLDAWCTFRVEVINMTEWIVGGIDAEKLSGFSDGDPTIFQGTVEQSLKVDGGDVGDPDELYFLAMLGKYAVESNVRGSRVRYLAFFKRSPVGEVHCVWIYKAPTGLVLSAGVVASQTVTEVVAALS